jgi:arginyl-tRNA synthetase
MDISEKIIFLIKHSMAAAGIDYGDTAVTLEHPTDLGLGDYSTNIALILAKKHKTKPADLAKKIAASIEAEIKNGPASPVEKVETAGAGFINFFLSPKFLVEQVVRILSKPEDFGKNVSLLKEKVIIEYTDPNAFKPLHIGHLMSNAIGESLSRLAQFGGAQVRRATYGSDVGLNVAMAVWGMQKLAAEKFPGEDIAGQLSKLHKLISSERIDFVSKAYVYGAQTYEKDEVAKKEIGELNRKIYTHSDEIAGQFYVLGKTASIEHFNKIFDLLGSRFDHQIWESDIAAFGEEIVKFGLERGIFEKSDGAIIYPGEKKGKAAGLHNRVFINSHGIPTYEAKELGLTKKKFELHDFDTSVVITGNEQNDYFKVVMSALSDLYPEIAKRTKHIGHGMMRFAGGKMSSRTGNVVTGESLLDELAASALEKMENKDKVISYEIAIAAFKYAVLKQSIGRNIVFDPDQSISFEGDSGPYLQYSFVRTQALLAKAKKEKLLPVVSGSLSQSPSAVTRLLYRLPEIVSRATEEYSPQYLATYLINLASEFNHWYAAEKIIDPTNKEASQAKLAVVAAVGAVLRNGLWLLAIAVPERM